MPIEKAKKHYQGKDGHQKLNCAQSVVAAFRDTHGLTEEDVGMFSAHGGGRAPEGLCGAVYAASYLTGDKEEEVRQSFVDQAGAITCHEIRTLRKLPCIGCVEHGARLVAELSQ